MRVLFWSEAFFPEIGGVEILATKLLGSLRARGYEFVVVARQEWQGLPTLSEYDGIPVHRYPFRRALHARDVDLVMDMQRRLSGLTGAFRPDLVHLYFLGPSAIFLRHVTKGRPSPLLVTLHDTYRSAEPDTVLHSALRSADWITACSSAALSAARRLLPEIAPISSCIPNGLEPPIDAPEPLPFAAPRLLCLGRVTRQKGFDVALAAFVDLVDRFPSARLVVAGDGVGLADLREQAARLGVADAVDFLGWVAPEEVPALLNRATLVLIPSRWEGLPLVALQAAQMARPVVATRVDGLPEAVVQGETGLLVDSEDRGGLVVAVASLLDHPETARRMGDAARDRALELFGWERHVDAYDALYRQLVGARPRQAAMVPR